MAATSWDAVTRASSRETVVWAHPGPAAARCRNTALRQFLREIRERGDASVAQAVHLQQEAMGGLFGRLPPRQSRRTSIRPDVGRYPRSPPSIR
jgi:hypothetical protein